MHIHRIVFIATQLQNMPFYCSENKAASEMQGHPDLSCCNKLAVFLPSKFSHQLEAISQSHKKFDKRNSFMKLNCTGVSDHIHVAYT